MTGPAIILVTYNWPPRNAIGVHRPYAWAKHWSCAGAKVTVLTARKCSYDRPLDLHLPALPGVEVVEVPYRVGDAGVEVAGRMPAWLTMLKEAKRRVAPLVPFSLDPRDKWVGASEGELASLARSSDIVVSTFGPAATHLIAARMKVVNPTLRWVADYRDLWSQSHLAQQSSLARSREAARELASVGRCADVVTTVSKELAAQLAGFIGKDVQVVMNGFDVDTDIVLARLADRSARRPGRPVRIVHTGMIYPGHRDPGPLFRAIDQLAHEGELRPGELLIEFFGARAGDLEAMVQREGIVPYVRIGGHVTREESLELQVGCDAQLLLESGAPEALGVVPGKLFEYIGSGAPIISLGSRPESAIGRILDDTGMGTCLGSDKGAMKAALKTLLHGRVPEWFRPRDQNILEYSREMQALRMYRDLVAASWARAQ